jgi:integrase
MWRRIWPSICGGCAGAAARRATAEQLDRWQDALPTLTLIRWQTAMIRPYYAWLHAKGVRPDNPAALLPVPAPPVRLPRPILEPDLARAIVEAPARVLPWLLLAGWCGLRASEIAGLDREHFWVDIDGQTWATVIGKGDRQRNVPVPGWLWDDLVPYLPDAGPAFRYVRGMGKGRWRVTAQHVSQYCNAHLRGLGLVDTLHALRHRLATTVLEQTDNLRLVQDLLGHADIGTTALYTKVRPTRMAAAVGAIPPPPNRPRRGLRAVASSS